MDVASRCEKWSKVRLSTEVVFFLLASKGWLKKTSYVDFCWSMALSFLALWLRTVSAQHPGSSPIKYNIIFILLIMLLIRIRQRGSWHLDAKTWTNAWGFAIWLHKPTLWQLYACFIYAVCGVHCFLIAHCCLWDIRRSERIQNCIFL